MTVSETALAEAARWLGTPYRHGGSTRGVACDCLGLVRGVWRALYGVEPDYPAAYAPDWEAAGGEPLLDAVARHMRPREGEALPGDVLVFRWRPQAMARHLGLLAHEQRFIHAYQGHGVVASALSAHWRRRLAGVFSFPPPGA